MDKFNLVEKDELNAKATLRLESCMKYAILLRVDDQSEEPFLINMLGQ